MQNTSPLKQRGSEGSAASLCGKQNVPFTFLCTLSLTHGWKVLLVGFMLGDHDSNWLYGFLKLKQTSLWLRGVINLNAFLNYGELLSEKGSLFPAIFLVPGGAVWNDNWPNSRWEFCIIPLCYHIISSRPPRNAISGCHGLFFFLTILDSSILSLWMLRRLLRVRG